MKVILLLVGSLVGLASLGCTIYVIVEAFKEAIWKGILCIFTCGLYWLYYALFEFEDDNKWPIVLGAIFGNGIAAGIVSLGR